jgi:hypothetical protein
MAFGVRLIGGAFTSGAVVEVDIPYLLESAGPDYNRGHRAYSQKLRSSHSLIRCSWGA